MLNFTPNILGSYGLNINFNNSVANESAEERRQQSKGSHLNGLPSVGYGRPLPVPAHHLAHLLDGRVRRDHVVEGQLVLVVDAADVAPPGDLPQHQAQGVHVRTLERVEVVHVDALVQHLRRHIPPGADPVVHGDVHHVGGHVVPHGEPQVPDGARPVTLHQDIFRFQVPVGDGGFTCQSTPSRLNN